MSLTKLFQITRSFAVGQLVTLYELNLTDIGGGVFYFTNNVFEEGFPIAFGGNIYTYMPVAIEGIEASAGEGNPQPRLMVATSGGPVNALVLQYKDLRGATVIRRRTFAEFLDQRPDGEGGVETNPDADPMAYLPEDSFIVDRKIGANKTVAEFQLVSPTDQDGIKLPLRVVSKRYCDLVYRFNNGNGTFTYSGRHNPCPWGLEVLDGGRFYDENDRPCTAAEDRCSKTIRGCALRFKTGMKDETPPRNYHALPFSGFPGVRGPGEA